MKNVRMNNGSFDIFCHTNMKGHYCGKKRICTWVINGKNREVVVKLGNLKIQPSKCAL